MDPMRVPPPDFSLIDKHKENVNSWRLQTLSWVKSHVESGQPLQPFCFCMGYDYDQKRYRNERIVIDRAMLDSAQNKLGAYYFLRDLKQQVNYQMLALMFICHGFISQDNEETWETVLYVTFETSLVSTIKVYHITEDVTESDEQPSRRLELDKEYSSKTIDDEMQHFSSLFHCQLQRN